MGTFCHFCIFFGAFLYTYPPVFFLFQNFPTSFCLRFTKTVSFFFFRNPHLTRTAIFSLFSDSLVSDRSNFTRYFIFCSPQNKN
jgi:hypothetical protein